MTPIPSGDAGGASVAAVVIPQAGPQAAFLDSRADIAIYGGAAGGGKSWALLAEPLSHIGNEDFGGVIFRRTTVQVRNEGGLWDESMRLYPRVGGKPRSSTLEWRFPSGASLSFAHLEHETTALNYQGAQIAFLGFDELTHFTEGQFWYLLSRNRSTSGVKPYVRATTNPDADSWVARLIAWWIDPATGLAIPRRAGVLRWFARVGGRLRWAESAAELVAAHPGVRPKSLTFIPASLADNRILEGRDPDYRANLEALPPVERERLLAGNWKVRATARVLFRREWFPVVDAAPAGGRVVRAWDLAATEAKACGPDPDWTASVRVRRVPDADEARIGTFYVEVAGRLRGTPAAVEALIRTTAGQDGTGVAIRLPQDPGQAGKAQAATLVRLLAGYDVKAAPVTGDKVSRAGNIRLLRGAWNDDFLDELEAFPAGRHDDWVDALADAINELALGSSYTLANL
jgi:predicted phage terminase large subunit-like protein